MSQLQIVLLGTCDTKLDETLFLREQIIQAGTAKVILLDVGCHPVDNKLIDVPYANLAAYGTDKAATDLFGLSRAEYIKRMIDCTTSFVSDLFKAGKVHGIVSAGGSSGTSLVTAVMRDALPVGVPKLMVSTMASGDVGHLVEETDITLMYSVVDIAGINSILNQILRNAAGAILGAATAYHQSVGDIEARSNQTKKRVAITMFGVTTPCVDAIRAHLTNKYGYEVYVFHATGAGGKAMERLVREKQIDAVLDVTTTEIADELVGGVLTAGPNRLTAAAQAGIPQILSVGACDMVNFGPRDTVPAKFSDPEHKRLLHEHNPAVTLMRTSPDECTQIADFIAAKLREYAVRLDLVQVLLPTGGISVISTPSQPFHDSSADTALFDALESRLKGSGIAVLRDKHAINDSEFATLAAESLVALIRQKESNA